MFRRKSRSVHNTSYTGVNHVAPSSSQPNSNALAAALTIGHRSGESTISSRANSIQRSGSLQQMRHSTSSTLLKRSPSIVNGTPSSGNGHDQPHQFRNFSSSSAADNGSIRSRNSTYNKLTYDIDDSMNDSYLDEITEETTKRYDNHDAVRDLKLSHSRAGSAGGIPKRLSINGLPAPSNYSPPKVKMVKKYIPTPTGIKVIEVPEENFKQEISRNNSIRSGNNIPRTRSINSLAPPGQRQARRKTSSRLSSIVKSPVLQENQELEAETNQSSRELLEYEQLQKKIDEEKALQKKLEGMRHEYEELKRKRVNDQEKLRSMEREMEDDGNRLIRHQIDAKDTSSLNSAEQQSSILPATEEIPRLESPIVEPAAAAAVQHKEEFPTLEKPILHELSGHEDGNNFISPSTSNYEESDESADDIPAIDPSNLVVDEVESKAIKHNASPEGINIDNDVLHDVVPENDVHEEIISEEDIPEDVPETVAPGGIDPSKLRVDEVDKTSPAENDDFGIEEVELDADDTPNLKKDAQPVFDPVPSIITESAVDQDNYPVTTEDDADPGSLRAPVVVLGSSSSSVSSEESPSRAKRPMKSAMKNSTSFYNQAPNNGKANAAHQAYLSLTTAENTRLNSKLSSPSLNDISSLGQSHHYHIATPPTKRMSTTLRGPPPLSESPNMTRTTLRPQSAIGPGGPPAAQPNGGSKMSNRSLRDRSSIHVSQMSPHPALQPNYQSPAKLRAEELYAKAKQRPYSQFNVQRKSSWTNEQPRDERKPITTLRDSTLRDSVARDGDSAPQQTNGQPASLDPKTQDYQKAPRKAPPHQQPTTPVRQTSNGNSRIPNSPDEEMFSPDSAFSSRIVDSDDEKPDPLLPYSHPQQRQQAQRFTLRPQEEQSTKKDKKSTDKKEKKKIGGRLRKIFGRS